MGKSRQRKPGIVRTDLNAGREKFLRPFLLGIAFASLLLTVPTFSGIYWVCKDVSITPTVECPRLLSKKETKKGKLKFLQKKGSEVNDVELELVPQDPVACACQLVWNFLQRSSKEETQNSMTCSPKEKETHSSISKRPSPEMLEKYKVAYTPEKLTISSSQKQLISAMADRTKENIPDWEERASKVKWGGSGWNWYAPKQSPSSDTTDLEKLDGGSLYYAYLRIMKWPQSLYVHFPLRLCAKGCDAEVAFSHTLEFREKYQPWMVSPAVMKENSKGSVFWKGFSISRDEKENAHHSVVWIRPGLRNKADDVANLRVYVNTLERAVAAALERSNGRVGKFNVIVDGDAFSLGLMPSMHQLKVFVTMLQDHFPDRVGIILLTNLGRIAEMLLSMFLKLLTPEVRNKIIVLPHDPKERQDALNAVVGYKNIPKWLGGTDDYEFSSDDYYSDEHFIYSDAEANAYLETMPYHA